MEMKIAFALIALLVCTNLDLYQAASLSSNQMTNQNTVLDSLEAAPEATYKPSAHIESTDRRVVNYGPKQVITDWSAQARHSHLEGGMRYEAGHLTVPISGRYYIYTQLYFHNNGRAYVRVNQKIITMIQPATSSEGSLYTGGVFKLNAGDVISLSAANNLKLYMSSVHSYFGAYLI